ncbi:non-ribosomal peptide synthetase [Bacillus velezensis]|uniref:non-ribosomal peptide synthetase n=1 Tax=Bacillus velezensis TaxID=492670 RepID=UPI000849E577|nr:non-ribosomal peptide synthetase [Bacillus velezensis]MDX7896967.1 non-ribosomal peptide synthetase [Bacillus velezensis]MDX8027685.1 non-ribosomal peptide synthetase [Bacillus velezensis]MDX8201218.1 non-ribosomal peptide synthetase [Bacillus velezensis]MDX8226911.1 non-ribosomal peptide synthetase [Bacillus velezensis]MEC2287031.1 non-ribosomal peptide synthetase [Bacillus velezensis]
MDDISIIKQYVLEQVKEQKMDREMALRILKGLSDKSKKNQCDIAIIGISCRFSKANNAKEYWQNIMNRASCIRDLPEKRRKDIDPLLPSANENSYFRAGFLDEIDKFDSSFFRISPREAMLMDPKQRLFLETVYHAIEDSGYAGNKLQGSNTGIFVGHDHSGDLKFSYASLVKDADMIAMTGTYPGILASRTSYIFNLKGPSLVVDTACSSGLVSVHLACEALKNEECSMAIAGGVNLFLRPENIGTMSEIEAENAKISIFDKNAKGTAWGEGISAIVLKPLHRAIEDRDHIYAVIKGSATNNDGASNGITAPNAESQEKLISRAWKNANISPETISYIETHGTGTILGDPIEIKGITNAFKKYTDKKQFCGIGSVKPNIGHTVGASGMASLIKACMALKEKVIPPSINFNEPNPLINFSNSPVYVNDMIRNWEKGETPRRAGVSSFGFSGTNCHIVLEEAPEIIGETEQRQVKEVFTLSAKNKSVLNDIASKYLHFISEENNLNLSDLCYTANTGRKHLENRVCFLVKDIEDLKEKLESLLEAPVQQEEAAFSYKTDRDLSTAAGKKLKAYNAGGRTDESLLIDISKLYEKGAEIDWEMLYEGEKRRKISLPGYAFLRERHWVKLPEKLPISNAPDNPSVNKPQIIRLSGREDGCYSETELMAGQIWGNALGINPIDVTSDFYEMGGDSIIAIEIINFINKQQGTELSVSDLLKHSNIKLFSAYLDEYSLRKTNDVNVIPKAGDLEWYEASSAQKRIFILDQLNKNSTSYNIPFFLMIEGELDDKRLEDAFKKLIIRHEVLRTSIGLRDGQLVQIIEKDVRFKMDRIKTSEEELESLMSNFVRPFDVEKAPLLRAGLAEISHQKHLLMIDLQHIIADGASIPIFQRELINLYEGNELPSLNIQFKDFAIWQNELFHTEEMKKQKDFWLNEFKGEIPVLNLPADFSREAERDDQGERIYFYAGRELTAKLTELNAKQKVTLFMTLMASFNVLLHKLTGQEDIIIGTPVAGRKHKELENMIGMFVNTLALRNKPSADKTFKELLEAVRDNALLAYENQDYPFEELVDHLNLERDINQNALFNVMFVLQLMDNPAIEVNGLKYKPYLYENKTAKFDLLLQAFPSKEDIKFEFTYSSNLFKRTTVEKFSQRFLMILNHIVESQDGLIGEINILEENERREILSYSGRSLRSRGTDASICELFEKQAEATPNQIAVSAQDGSLTYSELNKNANRLGRALIQKGVKKNEAVGIAADRTTDFIIGIMGILKAGAAYLPIDPSYPQERVEYMLKDSGARLLLTDRNNHGQRYGVESVCLNELETVPDDGRNVKGGTEGHSLAYIIYTSGSTGHPKGVMIEHKSIANLTEALHERIYCKHGGQQNVALLAPFSFDASVKQIFSALLLGHSLYIVSEEARHDITKLAEFYIQNKITISDGTPAYLSLLSESPQCGRIGVKHFIIGGEVLKPEEVKRFYKVFKKNDRPYITNVYGPTECCVDAAAYTINQDNISNIKRIPIGTPIKNCSIYILDKQQKPVPPGVIGELYIGGEGVGRGYCNREELTKAKFIPDLVHSGEKMYKTGDLGKWNEDGNIEFAGRIDRQVKIRGFRIELDEIINRLLSHRNVQEAVAIAHNDQIYAYTVCKDTQPPSQLKEYLLEYLPEYMIPTVIIGIDKIPLTNNGKTDVKRLPLPAENNAELHHFIAPRNEIERIVSEVWSDILEVSKISIKDNFFVLGGDSIKAIQAAVRMEKFNLRLEVKDIFHYQTIEGVSNKVSYITAASDNSVITGEARLVPIQCWLAESHNDTLHHRNLSFMLYREAGFGEDIVKDIFTRIIQHHDSLRTVFKRKGDRMVQVIRGLTDGDLFDFHLINAINMPQSVLKMKINQIQASMDLTHGPLVKLALIKEADGEHLLIVIHQMIIDHMSWRILLEDFNTAYQQVKSNEDIVLPNKTDSYLKWSDYLYKYAESERLLFEKEYWTKIENVYTPSIPVDIQGQIAKVKDNRQVYRQFNVRETENIMNAIQGQDHFTIETVLLTALGLTVKHQTGSNTSLVHLGNHGRTHQSEKLNIYRTVGRFSAIYPVALEVSDSDHIGSSLDNVNSTLANIPDQGIGYGILRYLKQDIKEKSKPDISFNYMGEFDNELHTESFTVSPLSTGNDISEDEIWNYKFKFIVLVREKKLSIGIEYNQNQYYKSTVENLLNQYMRYIKKAAETI